VQVEGNQPIKITGAALELGSALFPFVQTARKKQARPQWRNDDQQQDRHKPRANGENQSDDGSQHDRRLDQHQQMRDHQCRSMRTGLLCAMQRIEVVSAFEERQIGRDRPRVDQAIHVVGDVKTLRLAREIADLPGGEKQDAGQSGQSNE